MKLSTRKSRGGRPRLNKVQPGDRVPMGFRATPDMKRALDRASQQSGRSLSQEIEFRLERSFDRAALLDEILILRYGPRVAGVAAILLEEMRFHEGKFEFSTIDLSEGGKALVLEGRHPNRADARQRFQFNGGDQFLEAILRRLQQEEMER